MGFLSDLVSGGGADPLAAADKYFSEIDIPDYARMEEELRQLLATEQITPEEYKAIQQDPSLLAAYKADPRLREAQFKALSSLEDIGGQGGLTAVDRARISDIQRSNAQAERGSREAIIQGAAERGVGGTGLELASQLSSGQASADRAAREAEQVAARAEERALAAISGAGSLGGQMRGQEFGEAERTATAQDAINRFNAANQTEQSRAAADARNRAQEINVARRFEGQTDINELKRKKFADEMARAQGRAGIATERAGMEEGRRKSGAQLAGGLGGAALMAFSDEDLKEDVEGAEPDLESFMKGLTVNKYDFKEPDKYGEGKHFGPMAQDLEKSEVGESMVEEDQEGVKRVDAGKSQMVMLAVLKDLYDRMERLENGAA